MTDYKTLRVPEDAWQEAKEQKEANDRTWGEQLVCSNNTTTEGDERDLNVVDNDALYEARDEILAAIGAERGDVAQAEHIRELKNRIDDLEAQLPTKLAEELR